MDKIVLTSEEVKNIAEACDIGHDVFINRRTREIIELPNLLTGPIMEYNEYHTDDLENVEAHWHEISKIECLDSNESFDIMASFVDNLPESELRGRFIKALNNRKPFRNFNHIVHNSEVRDIWFKHKSQKMQERVIGIIEKINQSLDRNQ